LILRKISTFDATRCQILRLKCTKFDFLWVSAQEPAGGSCSAQPDPLPVFKGAYFYTGRAGKREGREKEYEGETRRGKEKKGRGKPPIF